MGANQDHGSVEPRIPHVGHRDQGFSAQVQRLGQFVSGLKGGLLGLSVVPLWPGFNGCRREILSRLFVSWL